MWSWQVFDNRLNRVSLTLTLISRLINHIRAGRDAFVTNADPLRALNEALFHPRPTLSSRKNSISHLISKGEKFWVISHNLNLNIMRTIIDRYEKK